MKKEPKKAEPSIIAKSKREDGKVDLYGVLWPGGTPMVSVELACYRDAGTERAVEGNLGAEEHFRRAWKLMWPAYEFSDWVDLIIYAWTHYRWIAIIGHERASKSFTGAHAVYLDYCSDPENTLTTLGTVTFDGLKIRMWSDVLHAAETAAVKFPFTYRSTTNEMRIYPTEFQGESAQKMQVMGMAMNNSADAPGRVKGGHAPRRVIVLDEAEDVADVIHEAMINPMSAPFARSLKLCNPIDKLSVLGREVEPKDGWESVTPASLMWECKTSGSVCLHFDGLQSPNVKAGKNKFTGLLTLENIEEIRSRKGEDSKEWWSLIRGWFPPDGIVSRIFPSSTLQKARATIVYDFKPMRCASLDPAYEGDQCVLHLGDIGPIKRGDKLWAINGVKSFEFKLKTGAEFEPKEYQIAHEVMRICSEQGVKPEHYIQDTTGNGRGVYAILQKEWSREVQSVNYGGKATERNLRADDDRKCEEIYKYFVTELWCRAAEFCAEGLIGGLDNLHVRTLEDLSSRRYETVQATNGRLMVAEQKGEVKKRLGRSPDHGDAFVQFGELLERLGTRPGLASDAPTKNQRWDRHREKAVQLASVYRDELQFTTGDSW